MRTTQQRTHARRHEPEEHTCTTDISTTPNTIAAARGHPAAVEAEAGRTPSSPTEAPSQASILTLLAERPMNGYELITELETRSEGRWRPSPGAIYPALSQVGGARSDRPRRCRPLTVSAANCSSSSPSGAARCSPTTTRSRAKVPLRRGAQRPARRGGDLRGQLFELVGQARRLRRVGTSDQVRRASAIIGEATVKLTAVADETPAAPADAPDDQSDADDREGPGAGRRRRNPHQRGLRGHASVPGTDARPRRSVAWVRPLRKSIDRSTVAATKRSSFGAAMNRAVASSGQRRIHPHAPRPTRPRSSSPHGRGR